MDYRKNEPQRYLTLVALFIFLNVGCYCIAESASCKATVAHKLHICVDMKPLQYDRCNNAMQVHFNIASFDPTEPYVYKLILTDGNNITSKISGTRQPDLVADSDLIDDEIPFTDSFPKGDYHVSITATSPKGAISDSLDTPIVSVEYHSHVSAVVIGVSSYENGKDVPTDDSQITNLKYPLLDAESVKSLLESTFGKSPNDNFQLLTLENSQATASAIRGALESQKGSKFSCRNGLGGDLFIFYYSGHTFGIQASDDRYLGAWDINPNDISSMDISYDFFIDYYLKHIHANKLVVLDSCLSGSQITLPTVASTESHSVGSSTMVVTQPGGRFEFAAGGHLRRDLLAIPSQNEIEITSNSLTFIGLHSEFGFYTAAQMNKEAQEGAVVSNLVQNSHFIFLDEPQAKDQPVGHGLYTYELLVALEKQIPASRHMKDVSGEGDFPGKWRSDEQCALDFTSAHVAAAGAISNLAQDKKRDLQMPTQAGPISIETLPCVQLGNQ